MTSATTWMLVALAALQSPPGTAKLKAVPIAPTPVRQTSTPQMPGHSVGFIEHCQVFLISDVKIPARESGVLVSMEIEESAQVRRGQILAKIDTRQAQIKKLATELEQQAAMARATDDIEVRHALAALEVAKAELNESLEINHRSPGSVSTAALRRLELTQHRAELQIDRSRLDLKVAGMLANVNEAAVASAAESLDRRQIIAPFDGTIVEMVRQRGEWVNAGEPVLQIIRLDQLRVEGFLDIKTLNPEDIVNRAVTVETVRARGQKVRLEGTVTFVSPMVHAGGKYRVRAQIQNVATDDHWLLLPGMSAAMTIHVGQ